MGILTAVIHWNKMAVLVGTLNKISYHSYGAVEMICSVCLWYYLVVLNLLFNCNARLYTDTN